MTHTHKPWKRVLSLAAVAAFAVLAIPTATAFAAEAGTDTSDVTVILTAGDLELVNAPDLDFGSSAITTGSMVLPVSADGVVQVSDLRGSGAGWSLSAALSVFEAETDGTTNSLPGAFITIASSVINGDDPTNPAEADANLTLTAGGAPVKVLYADQGKGLGSWTSTWGTAQTTLTIPDAELVLADTHTATIDWVLYNTPNLT